MARAEELKILNEEYNKVSDNLVVLYGRKGSGKTTLIKEFSVEKQVFWFHVLPGSPMEIKRHFIRAVSCQYNKAVMSMYNEENSFFELLSAVKRHIGNGKLVIVMEEFQHMVKISEEFMDGIVNILSDSDSKGKIFFLLSTASVYFVENSMISAMGAAALSINSFIKLKELSFVDTVRMFPEYSVEEIVKLYAVTGGIPEYMAAFSPKLSFKENVKKLCLSRDSVFEMEGLEFVKSELRETTVYNTILSALASGRNKLNEIHAYTGYGRDKISVYMKNLTERDIVEKIFSYDSEGYVNTKKGLYRIKDNFVYFWYRFIYPDYTAIGLIPPEEFYGKYMEGELLKFTSETFNKVAMEFLELMDKAGKLPLKILRKGSWYGKNGNIGIICESQQGLTLLGDTNSTDQVMTMENYDRLLENAVLAGIKPDFIFLFSIGGFNEELQEMARKDKSLTLIGIDDL